jgi:ATP-binding cassette subfamily B protein
VSTQLGSVIGGLIALFIVQGIAFFVRSYLFGLLGQRVYADLRERIFKSLLAKQISFFDAQRSSDLAARINSDAALVQDAVAVKLSVIVRYGLQVVCGVVLMLCMSFRLTAAIVLSVLCMVGVSALFVTRLKKASRMYQTDLSRFTSFASECFTGVKVVHALAAQAPLAKKATQWNKDTLHSGERRVLWSATFSSGVSALLNIVLVCVAWYGISLVLGGTLPRNELAAFVLYGGIVAVSFSFLVSAYTELMQNLGGLERVFELLDEEQTRRTTEEEPFGTLAVRVSESIQRLQAARGIGVVFSKVSFAYPGRETSAALDQFSFSITPGSFSALVGPSGAGKSSVVQLLCKLYAPDSGAISLTANGAHVELNSIPEDVLRGSIAWVPQEPQLFGFSIYDNLVLGNEQVLRDEVLKAVHSWEFLDFIDSLENGIDTVLGEHGTLLSGGQRQRLAIARALLRKPSLLILDEATSGLDSETEQSVMRVIRHVIPEATLLVVSHRLSTVCRADAICVMHQGRIIESGTHSELTQVGGLYQSYNELQNTDAVNSGA